LNFKPLPAGEVSTVKVYIPIFISIIRKIMQMPTCIKEIWNKFLEQGILERF
jgi:hypothetical protein